MKLNAHAVAARYGSIVARHVFRAVFGIVAAFVTGACSSGRDQASATWRGRVLDHGNAMSASSDDVEVPQYTCVLCMPDGRCFTSSDFDEDMSRYVVQRQACGDPPGEPPDASCRIAPSDASCTKGTVRVSETLLTLLAGVQPR